LSTHASVIDLDITELAAILLTKGGPGTAAAISIIDESLSALGPVANVLVQNAMTYDERTSDYTLPRNYTGKILANKLIAEKVTRLGLEILSDRGLVDDAGFTNPVIEPIMQILTNPNRVIHNFTMLAEYDRREFVARLGQRLGKDAAENAVPQTPPNGISYPVTAYAATIISTEHGGVVIAPNDFNSMLFDLQLIASGSVSGFIKELSVVAEDVTPKSIPRTIVYGIKIPGGTEINSAVFADEKGNWSAAFSTPEDDIQYLPLSNADGSVVSNEFVVASNKTDLLVASALRDSVSLANLDSAGDYIAKLSDVPLAKRNETTKENLED
jgi:hypothetical protein